MPKTLTSDEVIKRIKQNFIQDIDVISPYINKRSLIKLKCNKCGHEWETICRNALYGYNHSCPQCINTKIELTCDFCGKSFLRNPSALQTKSNFHYCSRECGNRHKNQLRKESGEWDDSGNYRLRAFEEYEHKCIVCGWNEDERILEVHHKDENRKNNNIDNLCILCPNCHRKITLHYYQLTDDYRLLPM